MGSVKQFIRANERVHKAYVYLYHKAMHYYGILFPKRAARKTYRSYMKKELNLAHPKDFNEKIQWLKIFQCPNDPLIVQCADKWRVRSYVESCGCGQILNDVYFTWDTPRAFRWDLLPQAFVLKLNRGAGMNIVCADKSRLQPLAVQKRVAKWFGAPTGEEYSELHYRKAKPVVLCEKYLKPSSGLLPVDYKIHCFNGEPKLTMVCVERDKSVKFIFVDNEYQPLDINTSIHSGGILPEKPKQYERMLEYAKILAKPFVFVRVDFFYVNEQIYLSELTFTPQGGYIDYISDQGLELMGDWLTLPTNSSL